jgi:hypothetical protein
MHDHYSAVAGYARLRADLETLAGEFEDVDCPLFCQLLFPLLAPIDWPRFLSANDQGREWQEWERFPHRDCRARFFGDEEGLSAFTTLAKRGFDLLLAVAGLEKLKRFRPPEGMEIQVPAEQGHLGWLWLVFQTARCYSTATLQADPGFWNHSGAVDLAKASAPFVEELRGDLFASSAEAIRLWLDPSEAVCIGPYVEDSPIYLPPPPEQDGPQFPDLFWLQGKCYSGFANLAMRFLGCIWGRDSVTIQEAIDTVYGDEVGDKDTAIYSLQKRINLKFLDQEAPVEIKRRDARFYLYFFERT